MRIRLKANFDIDNIFARGEIELDGQTATVRTLLDELSHKCQHRVSFIDPESGDVDFADYEILVNGTGCSFLPKRLDTELHDGDQVEIIMIALGGG